MWLGDFMIVSVLFGLHVYVVFFFFLQSCAFYCYNLCLVSLFAWELCVGGQIEGDEKVSLELTDEIVRSMEVGSVFRDYVRSLIFVSRQIR